MMSLLRDSFRDSKSRRMRLQICSKLLTFNESGVRLLLTKVCY